VNLNLTLDTSQLDKLARFTNPKLFDRAIKAGIRQASSTAKTQAAKGIGSRYSLTAGRIKKDITVSIPPGGEFALLRFSRRPPSLAQFNAKPGTRGTGQQGRGRGKGWTKPAKPGKPMSAAVFRGQRKPLPGAFMARGLNGNDLVFRRDRAGKLHAQYGPSVGSAFLGQGRFAQELRGDVSTAIGQAFAKGYQKTLDAAARGFGGK
jgi:hypothetical protein